MSSHRSPTLIFEFFHGFSLDFVSAELWSDKRLPTMVIGLKNR